MSVERQQAAAIEDYALIADCRTAALVSRDGSVDWLCLPRFDSDACLASLLGTPEHGRWRIAPGEAVVSTQRAYRDGSMVLETAFTTAGGTVALIDFMPMLDDGSAVVRMVEGRRGRVAMQMRLALRFDYGASVPWVTRQDQDGMVAVAGPNLCVLRGSVETRGEGLETVADFEVGEGERQFFVLGYGASHLEPPAPLDAEAALLRTEGFWREWSGRCRAEGKYAAAVKRSLLTLKGLTYAPTGGIVAAPTASLPESAGGSRNWDYRYCWLRDSTLTLIALLDSGYTDEAGAWGRWLHRSVAGAARQMQVMYGVGGERRLTEYELDLPGYQGARPVRVGNQAAGQRQLDIFGELMGTWRLARTSGMEVPPAAWSFQKNLLEYLESIWEEPDEGIWEVRGGRKHFTWSKIMAWFAFDCMIRDAGAFGLEGDVAHWTEVRDRIHALVCARGFHAGRKAFTQHFDTDRLDASLLLMVQVKFLPCDDARLLGTIDAIADSLTKDGLVLRYEPDEALDGQAGGEGAFLPCSFWLVNCWAATGKRAQAEALFERLLELANDVGLLAEEYDPDAKRLMGNFPQAFSHLALLSSARVLREGERG